MSLLRKCPFCFLVLALFVVGCNDREQLPAIGHVTLIKVVKNNKEIRPEITSDQLIEKIVQFVDAQRQGWGKPWYGTPVPSITMEFYEAKDLKADFGIGKGFFEAQHRGGFWSKDATSDETAQILDLLSIPKKYLDR